MIWVISFEVVVFIVEVFISVDVNFFFFKDDEEVELIFKKEKCDNKVGVVVIKNIISICLRLEWLI